MKKASWFDDEPRLADFVRQVADLVVRGIRRPFLSLLCATLLAAGVAGVLVFAARGVAPRMVLRIVEGSGDPTTMPNPKRRLSHYVRDGIFTSKPLWELIRRYGLYPTLAKNDPRAAIDTFRSDIDVDVYQNYFVEERSANEKPRSARVAVSFRANDRATALAVTRDLAALVEKHETLARRGQAGRAAREAESARDFLRAAFERRTAEAAALRSEILEAETPSPERQVTLVALLGSLAALERDLDSATQRAASYELGEALEEGGVGLRFEIADEAELPSAAARARWVTLATLATFTFGLPLAVMAVGAFSTRRRA